MLNPRGVNKGPSINIDLFVHYLYLISWKADNPFDKVLASIHWKDENHHIPPFGTVYWYPGHTGKGVFDPVDEFIYKDVVSYQKGFYHGARGDLKGLDHKCPYKKGQNKGNYNCLGIFLECGYEFVF